MRRRRAGRLQGRMAHVRHCREDGSALEQHSPHLRKSEKAAMNSKTTCACAKAVGERWRVGKTCREERLGIPFSTRSSTGFFSWY